jgi:outer membrane protein with beta-barrel domain
MRKSIWIAALMLIISGQALAQNKAQTQPQADSERRVQTFGFIGIFRPTGGGSNLTHFGGGLEALITKGIGAGADISGNYQRSALVNGDGSILAILSVNGYYHFLNGAKSQRLDPFVTGGFSRAFNVNVGNGTTTRFNLFNFGGGTNFWLTDRFAVRGEFRDQVRSGSAIALRVGLNFAF